MLPFSIMSWTAIINGLSYTAEPVRNISVFHYSLTDLQLIHWQRNDLNHVCLFFVDTFLINDGSQC